MRDCTKTFLGATVLEEIGTVQARIAFDWADRADTILEIGCSTGYFGEKLTAKSRQVFGVDINFPHLRAARDMSRKLICAAASADKLPFKDQSFDLVILLEVLEHVGQEEKSIAEIHRVLKENGVVILSTPHKGVFSFLDPFNLKMKLTRLMPSMISAMERYQNTQFTGNLSVHKHFSLSDLSRLMNGRFEIERVFRGGFFVFPLSSIAQSVCARLFRSVIPLQLCQHVMNIDGAIQYGPFSYNVVIRAKKV